MTTIKLTRGMVLTSPTLFEGLISDFMRKQSKGRVFSGSFIKKDGTIRRFNGRATAKNAVIGTGTTRKLAFIDNNILIRNQKEGMDIDSSRKKAWRSFLAENLIELKVAGYRIIIPENQEL